MSEKSVKISIAGRLYPITVDAQEESFVNEAASRINERVAVLESRYAVKDKQDLLAMAALQFATQYLEAKSNSIADKDGLYAALSEVDSMLQAHLGKPTASA
jgi:cell division protein ZapA (FtsZ GTPase activity inhibitor)